VRVLLVNMPFAAIERPALGLSLLKARLAADDVECDVVYPNLAFAHLLGREAYGRIAAALPFTSLAGEWVFAEALYGASAPTGFVEHILEQTWRLPQDDLELVSEARAKAVSFICDLADSLPWSDYDLVGFTSSFMQNLSALSLARRVRELHPALPIVFGGHNWAGTVGVELHRWFPFVDVAFLGEADESFPRFIRGLRSGRQSFGDIPGLVLRRGASSRATDPPQAVVDLDALPIPDFGDYFKALAQSPFAATFFPIGMVEGSRGCWWAARTACLFCGLNGPELSYRCKSHERLLHEMRSLAARWTLSVLDVVDNVAPQTFLTHGLQDLASHRLGVPVMIEVRPDVTHGQVTMMRAADVGMQPGIESLSDHVLRLMRKGSTALENVRLLRWARECGVQLYWNFMYGLPGEQEKDYEQILELLPAVGFLGPPTTIGPVMLQRHSIFHREPEKYGFSDVHPVASYRYVYPFGEAALRRIALFFDYDYRESHRPPASLAVLVEALQEWQRSPDEGTLSLVRREDERPRLVDSRRHAQVSSIPLDPLDEVLILGSEAIASKAELRDVVTARLGDSVTEADMQARLHRMVSLGVMARSGGEYLSLALLSGT
jgi:ribosomal peptide maturation radical SAM protein 1